MLHLLNVLEALHGSAFRMLQPSEDKVTFPQVGELCAMTQWGHSLQIWKSGTLSPLDELVMSADQLGFHSCASLHIDYPVNNWMISIIHMVLYNKAGTPLTASESQPYSLPLLYNILLSNRDRVSNCEFSFPCPPSPNSPSPCLPSIVLCVLSGWVHFSFACKAFLVAPGVRRHFFTQILCF